MFQDTFLGPKRPSFVWKSSLFRVNSLKSFECNLQYFKPEGEDFFADKLLVY